MDWWPWGRTVKTLLGVCKHLLSARRRLTQQRGGRAPTHESLHTALLLHEGRACPACRRSQHGDRILGSLEP